MDKAEKKEIEELGDDIYWEGSKFELMTKSGCEELSKVLHKLGYGKVEDYKKEIERLKEENLQLTNSLVEASTYIKGLTNSFLIIAKSIKQQAIKEFAEKLKNQMGKGISTDNEDIYGFIDDLLKEYGIIDMMEED